MQRTTQRLTSLARTFSSSSAAASSSASTYAAPLKPGVLPAYDEALKYIANDKQAKLAQLEKSRASLSQEDAEKLEIEAYVNEPEVRWRAENRTGEQLLELE